MLELCPATRFTSNRLFLVVVMHVGVKERASPRNRWFEL